MHIDPNNHVVQLCAEGMIKEGEGNADEAKALFLQAWNNATDDFEKAIAAHYVARHQQGNAEKLMWDEAALAHALKSNGENMKAILPSLYLNIAKCYEDLHDFTNAEINYRLALSHTDALSGDGYSKMIKAGIGNGLERLESIRPSGLK
jgi:rifampin ADP-ribosylating transferase